MMEEDKIGRIERIGSLLLIKEFLKSLFFGEIKDLIKEGKVNLIQHLILCF